MSLNVLKTDNNQSEYLKKAAYPRDEGMGDAVFFIAFIEVMCRTGRIKVLTKLCDFALSVENT